MADFFVVGVTGQDGSLLARDLLSRGYSVAGTHRSFSPTNFWRLAEMGIEDKIDLIEYNIGNPLALQIELLRRQPKAVFFTAGDSATASSANHPSKIMALNAVGWAEQIEALRAAAPSAKAVLFSSSEVFGYQPRPGSVADETSVRRPSNPYGVSKLAAAELAEFYRREEGLRLYEAILFPHESPYRASSFLVRKIVRSLCMWSARPRQYEIPNFGSLGSTRDWGSASQYMSWLVDMTTADVPPGPYVIGSGLHYSVWDVFALTAQALEIELQVRESDSISEIIEVGSKSLLARAGTRTLANAGHSTVADMSKLRTALSAEDPLPLRDVIDEMVGTELQRIH